MSILSGLTKETRRVTDGIRCYGCHETRLSSEFHYFPFGEDSSSSFFPYCEICHKTLPMSRKKSLVKSLLCQWARDACPLDEDYQQQIDEIRSVLHATWATIVREHDPSIKERGGSFVVRGRERIG